MGVRICPMWISYSGNSAVNVISMAYNLLKLTLVRNPYGHKGMPNYSSYHKNAVADNYYFFSSTYFFPFAFELIWCIMSLRLISTPLRSTKTW